MRQLSAGEFLWQWTASNNRPAGQDLVPVWPEGCRAESNLLRCGDGGLRGTLEMRGVGQRYSAAMVKVIWLDGQSRVYTLTGAQPKVQLFGAADDPRGRGEIASAYTVLGIEHILTGYDHLLFVIALLLLVGFNRRLLLTITAFTAAHSVTLALSALGVLTLRPPPVEATIALSIMLVAGEALRQRETLARRWPALVAFLFGLVHGLGFAGALKDIGLPENHLLGCVADLQCGRRDRSGDDCGGGVALVPCRAADPVVAAIPGGLALRDRKLGGVLVDRARGDDPRLTPLKGACTGGLPASGNAGHRTQSNVITAS